jgi:type I restriction enzyme S subunit
LTYQSQPLGEIATIEREVIDPKDIQPGSRYVGLENIDSSGALQDVKVENGELASAKFAFSSDHILFGKLRPYLRKIALPTFDGICSTDIIPIKPGASVHRGYLFHFLRQDEVVTKAASLATGVNLPRLSPRILETFHVPLPPLDEQRRIAAILDQADDLRRKRRRTIEQSDLLVQSIFAEMFGPSRHERANWPKRRLGNLFELSNGINFPSESRGKGISTIDVKNMYTNSEYANVNNLYRVDIKVSADRMLRYRDLLFVRSSVREEGVGWPALFPGSVEPVTFCGFIIRGRPIVGSGDVDPIYIVHFLRQPHIRKKMISRSGKVAITNINQQALGNLNIALPPLDLQRLFTARVEEIGKMKIAYGAHVAKLDALFASLQHRAFRGEL